jgi:hypothetical protein
MRNILSVALLAFLLVSCATATTGTRHTLSKEEREKLLRERVMTVWTAMVSGDRGIVYDMYDPFFRAKKNRAEFKSMPMKIYYYNPAIEGIDIKDNVATVRVRETYEIKGIRMFGKEVNQSPKDAVTTETWIFIDDNWYRQYINYIMDESLADF